MNRKELARAAAVEEQRWRRATREEGYRRERKRRDSDLWDFRQKFKVANAETRMRLLVRMADASYPTGGRSGYTVDRMRARFNFIKTHYGSLCGKKCEVCSEPATVRHHVIQLQNGGSNHGNNIVRICDECHLKIHPWMSELRTWA
jgi:5-methylcytosine-specific restriction endonuclease McrA